MRKLNSDVVIRTEAKSVERNIDNNPAFTLGTFEWVQAIVLAVAIVVIMLTFLFRFVDVSGDSMLDTLHDGDKVLLSTFMYTPKQGDIIVISRAQEYEKPLVKRAIATEGQTVDIDFVNSIVYVDGEEIYEPYLTHTVMPDTANVEFPLTVPEDCVFVLGDNRPVSLDSRYTEIGFIEEKNILGKVQLIVYPFTRVSGVY